MPFVTQNWSGRTFSLRPPWNGTFQYVVSGTLDQNVALAAVPYQLNDPHPFNPARLKFSGPVIKEVKGVDFFVIDCPFSEPPGGRWADHPDDPLLEPSRISWEQCELIEPVDHDLMNRVISNSAGDVQGGTRRIIYDRLILEKNMPFYNAPFFRTFVNSVNDAVVNLSGVDSVATEHMRCATIIPAIQGYHPLVEFMPMKFIFDIMHEGVLGAYPWQHRLLDAGRNGWYGSPKKSGVFTNGREAVDFNVKLDGTGKPLTQPYGSTVINVGDHSGNAANAAVTPPNAVSVYAREYYLNNGTITGSLSSSVAAVFNYFQAVRVVDFSPLLDLFTT